MKNVPTHILQQRGAHHWSQYHNVLSDYADNDDISVALVDYYNEGSQQHNKHFLIKVHFYDNKDV